MNRDFTCSRVASAGTPSIARLLGSRVPCLLALAALVAVGGFACKKSGDNKGDEVGSPTVSIEATCPAPPCFFNGSSITTVFDLRADAAISHPAGVTPTFSFSWQRDGVDAGNTTTVVSAADTTKHQTWTVTAFANFGTTTTGPVTDQVVIANALPRVSLQLIQPSFPPPPNLPPGSPLNRRACSNSTLSIPLTVAEDDGDAVTLSYQWFVNSVQVATTPTLSSPLFVRGDFVFVRVTGNDVEENGPTVQSITVLIVNATDEPMRCPGAASVGAPSAPLRGVAAASGGGQRLDGGASPASSIPGEAAPLEGQISISEFNVCSIAADASLACSGDETFGLTDPPAGEYVQVAVGLDYACAIRADDLAIRCWGEPPPDSGLLSPPEGRFVQLGLGLDAACGLRETGEIACWGVGSTGEASPPEGQFIDLDVSDSHGCAIAADGFVSCWGR